MPGIKMSHNILTIRKGQGKELFDHIKEVLGIPDVEQSIKIEIDLNGIFTVTCTYLATDNSIASDN